MKKREKSNRRSKKESLKEEKMITAGKKAKNLKRRRNWYWFFRSFRLTFVFVFCICLLVFGLLKGYQQMQLMSFGKDIEIFKVEDGQFYIVEKTPGELIEDIIDAFK